MIKRKLLYNSKLLFSVIFFIALLQSTLITVAQTDGDLPNPPSPATLVTDFTGTLTSSEKQALEQKLVAFDDSTSIQLAVVIVPSTGGKQISTYAVDLGRKWGIGNAKNNGILLLVAKNDKQLDVEVGYGMERTITDETAKSIIDDVIVPNFKNGNFYRGIDEGTNALIAATQGAYKEQRNKTSNEGGSGWVFIIIFIILLIILFFVSRGGGGNGTYMSRRGRRTLGDSIFWGPAIGGGGWSGGGSSGGGGFGGFGGFGGGSFGGGGASGSW